MVLVSSRRFWLFMCEFWAGAKESCKSAVFIDVSLLLYYSIQYTIVKLLDTCLLIFYLPKPLRVKYLTRKRNAM